MTQQTLENLLSSLNKRDFYESLLPLLDSFFSLSKKSLRLNENNYTQSYIFQDTRKSPIAIFIDIDLADGWQENIISAINFFQPGSKPHRCLFFTNHKLSPAALTEFCNDFLIITQISIAAYSRYEIASMILEAGLFHKITGILKKKIVDYNYKIDYKLLYLHSCYDLCPDQIFSRNYILDYTLMSILYTSKKPVERTTLCSNALKLLNEAETEHETLNRRIDSLLSKAMIIKNDKYLEISDKEKEYFQDAEVIFRSELEDVSSIISKNLIPYLKIWDRKKTFQFAFLIARNFLHWQLVSAKFLRFSNQLKDVFGKNYNPWSKMKKILIENGIPPDAVYTTLLEICSQLKGHSLIVKISHTFTIIMLRSVSLEKKSLLFQASDWKQVNVYLDTPVAVQFLCANLFKPLNNHYSAFAEKAVKTLQGINASIYVTQNYLQEIADLLTKSAEYIYDERKTLNTRNPFIDFYLRYKQQSKKNSFTLKKYLSAFVKLSIRSDLDIDFRIQETTNELKRLFYVFGIKIKNYTEPRYDKICLETEIFLYSLDNSNTKVKRNRSVIERDVSSLIYLKNNALNQHQPQIFVTWDKILLKYVYRFHYYEYASFTTPQTINDILQIHVPPDEKELITIIFILSRFIRKTHGSINNLNEQIFSEMNTDQENCYYKGEFLRNQRYTLKRTIEDLPDDNEDSYSEETQDLEQNEVI